MKTVQLRLHQEIKENTGYVLSLMWHSWIYFQPDPARLIVWHSLTVPYYHRMQPFQLQLPCQGVSISLWTRLLSSPRKAQSHGRQAVFLIACAFCGSKQEWWQIYDKTIAQRAVQFREGELKTICSPLTSQTLCWLNALHASETPLEQTERRMEGITRRDQEKMELEKTILKWWAEQCYIFLWLWGLKLRSHRLQWRPFFCCDGSIWALQVWGLYCQESFYLLCE